MEDQVVDTGIPAAPEAAQEASANEQVIVEDQQLTGEEVQEQAQAVVEEDPTLHKLQSWIGRRDAELKREYDEKLNRILTTIQQTYQPQIQAQYQRPAEPEPPDPIAQPDEYWTWKYNQIQNKQREFNNTFATTAGGMIQNDPLVQQDPSLQGEIVEEIKRMPVDPAQPAGIQAQLAVQTARANVLARRYAQPKNPLAGNRPATAPLGTVTPAAAPTKKVKQVKLDEHAAKLKARFGYTDEQIAKVLGE